MELNPRSSSMVFNQSETPELDFNDFLKNFAKKRDVFSLYKKLIFH